MNSILSFFSSRADAKASHDDVPTISRDLKIQSRVSIVTAEEEDHGGSCRQFGMGKEEFLEKLKLFAHDKYGDDWEAMFRAYIQNDDKDLLAWEGLCFMMRDANIGNTLVRPVMATCLIVQLDKDEDRKLSLEEFLKVRDGQFEG